MKITRRQLKKLITESVSLLQEEEYDCIKDYMAMGYSRSEAQRECRGTVSQDRHPLDVDGDGQLTISEAISNESKSLSREDVADAWTDTTARIESVAREKGLNAEVEDAMKVGAQTLKTLLDNMLQNR